MCYNSNNTDTEHFANFHCENCVDIQSKITHNTEVQPIQ